MLSKILSKEDCSKCKFCCSFRRQSLWETPLFDNGTKEKINKIYPDAKFKPVFIESGTEKIWTIDIDNNYKTSNPEEEAPCPFLDSSKGCILSSDLKPFDCSIWPLRIMKNKSEENKLEITLTPTCPSVNKLPLEDVKNFVKKELAEKIRDYAQNHKYIIKENHKNFFVLD